MIENENYDIEEIDFDQIDFEKLNQVMDSISADIEEKKNSMTESEKEIYESADRVVELCDTILENRKEFITKLDNMNESEVLETYKKINQDASKTNEELQLETLTIEQIQTEKLNDKRDN